MLIASARSRSVRGSSHQSAFMNSCLTLVTRVCPVYLVEERCSFEVIYLSLGGW